MYLISALSAIFFCSGETEKWAKKTPIQRKTEKSLKNLRSIGVNLDLEQHGISMDNVRSIHKSLANLQKAGSQPRIRKVITVTLEDANFDIEN